MAVAAAYEAGTAWLQVVPSFDGVERQMKKQLQKTVDNLNESLSDAMPDGVKAGARAAQREAEKAGDKAGAGFAGHFAASLDRRMRDAFRALPDVKVDADSSDFDKAVAKVREDIEALRKQRVGIDIDARTAIESAGNISKRLRGLNAQAPDNRMRVDLSQAADEVEAWVQVARAGGERMAAEAKRAADESARIHQQGLDENLRRERKAVEERNRLHQHALDEDLRRTWLIGQERGRIHQQALDEDLRRDWLAQQERGKLYDEAVAEDYKRDLKARQNMARLYEQALAEDHARTRRAAKESAKIAEEEFGKTWAGRIQSEIGRAFQALPDVGLRPARTAAEQLVKDIRGRLETLRGQRIGIDVDADTALAEVAELRRLLADLARSRVSVDVQADAIDAAAKLTLVERMAERLSGRKVDLRIEADASALDDVGRAANFSLSRLESLTAVGLSMGTMLIPVAGAVAASIGFIGASAVSATAGIGVMILGFSGVGGAVQALNKHQQDSEKSAVSLAAAQDRVASAQDRLVSAQRSLANARAQADDGAQRAARQVADAERGVADARRAAGQAAQQAARQVADAQRQVTDARREAAEAVKAAVVRVADAEADYTRAQVDAREAREGLTRAYRDAAQALADLDSQVRRNALDQRQATLDVAEAKRELDRLLANPRASEEEREQARITYERRLQQIDDLKRKSRELAVEQAEANKKGVAGSAQVVAAQKRITDADRRVVDAQKALTAAREAVVRAQVDGARRISDAERRLSDARQGMVRAQEDGSRRVADAQQRVTDTQRAQAQQQRQAAYSIAQAQQQVISAQRQLRQAYQKTGVAGGDALDNLNEAMEVLTPTGQRFARFIFGLKDEFLTLRAAASDNLLPGVQSSIETLLPFLPRLRSFIGRVAGSVGGLFEETSRFLTVDPTWRRFFGYVDGSTVPTLERLYRITRNAATGVIGLFLAFTPFNDDVGGGLERLTERFATWSATLDQNQGFQRMLAYIRENGPMVMDLLGEMTHFVVRFVQAAAPVGTVVVHLFERLFAAINSVPMPVLQTLVVGLAGVAAAILAVNTATRLTALTVGTWKKMSGAYGSVTSAARSMADGVGGAMDRARDRSERFAQSMDRTRLAGLRMRGGLASVGAFLGGPWGVALASAALAAGYFGEKTAEQKARVADLAEALMLLGRAYRETRDITSAVVQDVVATSRELQQLINDSKAYGLSVEDIARAAAGEKAAQQGVLEVLQQRLDVMREQRKLEANNVKDFYLSSDEEKNLEAYIASLRSQFAATDSAARAQEALNTAQRNAPAAATPAQIAQQKVADAMTVLADKTATAAEKANALRTAQDALAGSAKSQIEAEEQYEAAVDNVAAALTKKNNSLDKGTVAGRANRDAVEALLESSVEMYNADVAAGVSVAEATRRHEARIAALREETTRVGANKTETERLIDAYGRVPTDVETLLSIVGYPGVDKQLKELAIQQKALDKNISLQESRRLYEKDERLAKLATGGPVRGPGTGTSDDVLLWGSNGEFMQPTASVKYYGQGFMEAIRRRRIPKEALPGFAKGGLVQWPFPVNVSKTKIPDIDPVPARSSGGIGSDDMMRILRRVFPGLALHSGYRPGSRTSSGSLSYHGRIAADGDKGRAVDVPPRMDVFNWLTRNYPDSREIIFTPGGGRQVWNGRKHVFQDPFVRRTHHDHVHWAYDEGGYLPPGVSTVFNGTGKPEPVFTDGQWNDISRAARNSHAEAREVHHWHFKEAALDHGRLQAWADRRDAMARPGRRP
ncbi:hypothetical protein ABT336_13295 [Micromonospora sp. NPDC000207]|uniref:hypothetical protein n=1 Tax=Micromonospora sp. NPDC000207 TaxID=3154246 RepID=UPI00331C4FCE